MSTRTRWTLLFLASSLALTVMYPPWGFGTGGDWHFAGYHFLLAPLQHGFSTPPRVCTICKIGQIDWNRLAAEWTALVLVATIVWLAASRSPNIVATRRTGEEHTEDAEIKSALEISTGREPKPAAIEPQNIPALASPYLKDVFEKSNAIWPGLYAEFRSGFGHKFEVQRTEHAANLLACAVIGMELSALPNLFEDSVAKQLRFAVLRLLQPSSDRQFSWSILIRDFEAEYLRHPESEDPRDNVSQVAAALLGILLGDRLNSFIDPSSGIINPFLVLKMMETILSLVGGWKRIKLTLVRR